MNPTTYIKWTEDLEEMAKFLLEDSKSYKKVSEELEISESALKSRNNKYWNIDCRRKWSVYNDKILKLYIKDMNKKDIACFFDLTENAISIRLSQLKEEAL